MNIQDVDVLAELAKIKLSKEEKENLLQDMDSILAYVKQIEDIEIPYDIQSDSQSAIDDPYFVKNTWKEDEIYERDFSLGLINSQYPKSKDGFVKVKKIL